MDAREITLLELMEQSSGIRSRVKPTRKLLKTDPNFWEAKEGIAHPQVTAAK